MNSARSDPSSSWGEHQCSFSGTPERIPVMKPPCLHSNAVAKKYVGTTETYFFCVDCFATFGGEETEAKKALIKAAATAEELGVAPDDEREP
jgi:hypothetical protein